MTDYLSSKVAIVTGGMSGIGKACATALVEAGARVIVADLKATDATNIDGSLVSIPTDVSRPDECSALIRQALQQFDRLDILINCAGVFADYPALEMDASNWRRVFDVNLHGVFFCSQALKSNPRPTDGIKKPEVFL